MSTSGAALAKASVAAVHALAAASGVDVPRVVADQPSSRSTGLVAVAVVLVALVLLGGAAVALLVGRRRLSAP